MKTCFLCADTIGHNHIVSDGLHYCAPCLRVFNQVKVKLMQAAIGAGAGAGYFEYQINGCAE